MKPLNKKERSRAFLKVIGLFLISFVIAIIVGFSTMNVSKLSDHNTTVELKELKKNLKFQEEVFAPNVSKTTELLSKVPTYKKNGENIQVLNQDIGALLSTTKNQIVEDESWKSEMYKNIIGALSALQQAYNKQIELHKDLVGLNNAGNNLQKYKAENIRLQNQIDRLKVAGGLDKTKIMNELKDTQNKLKQCNLENDALRREIEKYRNK